MNFESNKIQKLLKKKWLLSENEACHSFR